MTIRREDPQTPTIYNGVRLPADLVEQLDAVAAVTAASRSAAMRLAIEAGLPVVLGRLRAACGAPTAP